APSFLQLDDDDVVLETTPQHAELIEPELVPPAPSRARSSFVKVLLVTIVVAVSILIAIDISIALNVPWLDPRPLFSKLWRVVASKIPWESLPKVPKF